MRLVARPSASRSLEPRRRSSLSEVRETPLLARYHEKQIGALCAVHALNNLLQGDVFDEVRVRARARVSGETALLPAGARESERASAGAGEASARDARRPAEA